MAILPLVIAPDERLNHPSAPVAHVTDDTRKLADDMLDTMYANHGIGLAAVQVGVHQRIIVVDVEWRSDGECHGHHEPGNPIVFINPEIIANSYEQSRYNEGCLSFPDNYSEVERPKSVTVRYLDLEGNAQQMLCDGLLGTCIQHEIDHINGVVFVDHISSLKRDMILRKLRKAKKLGIITPEEHHHEVPR